MIDLYVGGHAGSVQGETEDLNGKRMFTAAHKPNRCGIYPASVDGLLDSGAFTDSWEKRLTPAQALDRQLRWEQKASEKWGKPFVAKGIVSYDLLIDETWVAGERTKRRWSVRDAEKAVAVTVAAAQYLVSQRTALAPRTLILSAQGVDAQQYAECAGAVLAAADPSDWFGLGGWCILGRFTSMLPEFWRTLYLVLPMIAAKGIRNVHIFGVLYQPALGGLAYLADQYGLSVSTDSTAPVMACTWKDSKKSGARMPYWKDNVAWWVDTLANIRQSQWYREPPRPTLARQASFIFEGDAA